MPQINRIRVNNVKYNFGTQFYDDFIMRFSCRNTLYDLANGGGKSVLMLLLLQNLIPNCTLDDKQPVEKLFRGHNTSQTIHSLVEWKLDSCDVRDGYRYMTTGFCARKGRDNGEEKRDIETANIEYFNYCIFYKEFGENDIKNLPLSHGEERITYNGLKAYLRDLPKKDLGVEVHIFDRKGDYQNFISNYGLYESQWEIIRGINKTEGHVRTYFENTYKTTRKVVEDLLIEEIIEKSYNNRIRKGITDDDDMAKTLLDIKDKLIELSRRRDEAGNYNNQISLLRNFTEELNSFRDVFFGKNMAQEELIKCLLSCRYALASKKKQMEQLESEALSLDEDYNNARKMVSAAELESEYLELDELRKLIDGGLLELENLKSDKRKNEDKLTLSMAAGEYNDYHKNLSAYNVTKELMTAKYDDEDKLYSELAGLVARKELYMTAESGKLSDSIKELEKRVQDILFDEEKLMQEGKTLFAKINAAEGYKKASVASLDRENAELMDALKEFGVLVADDIEEMTSDTTMKIAGEEETIRKLESEFISGEKKRAQLKDDIAALAIELADYRRRKTELEKSLNEIKDKQASLDRMKEIYGEQSADALPDAMERIHAAVMAEKLNAEKEILALQNYIDSISNNRIPDYDRYYMVVLKYLKGRYGESVMSGQEFFDDMTAPEITGLLQMLPFAPYAVFVKNNYEEIISDKVLTSLDCGSYVIPILDAARLPEYVKEGIPGAFRSLEYINDATALNSEIIRKTEEIEHLKEVEGKAADRCEVIYNDIIFVRKTLSDNYAEMESEYNDVLQSIVSIEKEKERLEAEEAKCLSDNSKTSDLISKEQAILKSLQDKALKLDMIALRNNRVYELRQQITGLNAELPELNEKYRINQRAVSELLQVKESVENDLIAQKRRLSLINEDFEEKCRPYFSSNVDPLDVAENEIDERIAILIKALSEKNSDMADKEQLLANYRATMSKCVNSMKYLGYNLEKLEELSKSGSLIELSTEAAGRISDYIAQLDRKITACETESNAMLARKNRIEGSIEHGRHLYEEQFGEFERPNLDEPAKQSVMYRHEMSRIKELKLELLNKKKALELANKDELLMEKDLNRIVKNAGIEVSDSAQVDEAEFREISAAEYEDIQKKYFSYVREEEKLKNDFVKKKQILVEELNRASAYELAQEILISLNPPEMVSDVDEISKGLNDTCECIALERDRIEKSMSDMEKIKENFEQRCIQICSNIKTELDRLPKLSRINLDDEIISIITLNIPYIKEEMYKDRMSVYINETVSAAETFDNADEKLKFIKGRLNWKKLFSVIVTDMNSIKLNLYKREHIKEQSRYLRYEEAVGSTGQSQGIYIQFLIAIINYISSINALGRDTAANGKTIFIDNPFGAAKDVYIWEPIFKMLSTNHTQLIVPARGTTPAITKMFDVNYVLGQKMVAGRQQTVVVDYRSQADMQEMEYNQLDYEQITFDF